jgi:hypothetical protein
MAVIQDRAEMNARSLVHNSHKNQIEGESHTRIGNIRGSDSGLHTDRQDNWVSRTVCVGAQERIWRKRVSQLDCG